MNFNLYSGIAIIIDDKVNQSDSSGEPPDKVMKIIDSIKEKKIPFITYNNLKEADAHISNFISINFLILDWDMFGTGDKFEEPYVVIKPEISPNDIQKIITFIKKFQDICFAPIFIFSNYSPNDIKDVLIKEGLYKEDGINSILIKNKNDLTRGRGGKERLFKEITNWTCNNPAIYTLKVWEKNFFKSKNNTFWNLFRKSSSWPKILWKSYKDDGVDPSYNLNETIYGIVKSGTSLIELDETLINKRNLKTNYNEIKDVIIGTMFLNNENIPKNEIKPGDIYKKGSDYFINIRPECDTVIGRAGTSTIDLYLLKGRNLSSTKFKTDYYHKKYGIIKKMTDEIIFGLDLKDIIQFHFKKLNILKYDEIKNNRICRLLPPYITNLQQRYSSFIGRIGHPSLPKEVLNELKKT